MHWLLLWLLLCAYEVHAQHGHWTDNYRGLRSLPCCGRRDCIPVRARILSQSASQVDVEVNGIVMTLPMETLHASEDASDWWCSGDIAHPISAQATRCLFIATGG